MSASSHQPEEDSGCVLISVKELESSDSETTRRNSSEETSGYCEEDRQLRQDQDHRTTRQEIALTAIVPEDLSPDGTPAPVTPEPDNNTDKMNGLSFNELCCLFCCPPCPGQIAAKLAFLPPEPTYSFIPDETNSKFTLSLTEKAEWQYSQRELEAIEVFYTRTSRGNRIGCMFIRAPNPKFTILFSHGNAVDLGQMSSFYLGLGTRINCNIFSYDYSGYGVSSGQSNLHDR